MGKTTSTETGHFRFQGGDVKPVVAGVSYDAILGARLLRLLAEDGQVSMVTIDPVTRKPIDDDPAFTDVVTEADITPTGILLDLVRPTPPDDEFP